MEAADLCGLGDHTLIERLDARDRGMLPAALNELRTAGDIPDTRRRAMAPDDDRRFAQCSFLVDLGDDTTTGPDGPSDHQIRQRTVRRQGTDAAVEELTLCCEHIETDA